VALSLRKLLGLEAAPEAGAEDADAVRRIARVILSLPSSPRAQRGSAAATPAASVSFEVSRRVHMAASSG
jgi:hypothetical protein